MLHTIDQMKMKLFLFLIIGWFAALPASDDYVGDDSEDVFPEAVGDVIIYTTTASGSKDLTRTAVDFSERDNMSGTTISLNPSERYQEMDGFGAAITGSTCFNLLQMEDADRAAFLKETFDPKKFGFSYIRISIGCSDFSLSEYTCCDIEGIENFALQHEEKTYIIPILKEILAINPGIKIMGSPWTCPKWMKVDNLTDLKPYDSWTSGRLNPAYYQDYGTYFVKWIQAFEEQGIPIYSITVQNEPLNKGNSASLYMEWEEQRDFVKEALGPKMKEAGLTTKIYAYDHNYNYDNIDSQKEYPIRIYEDAEAAQYLAGAAYHNYGGNREELLNIHEQRPDKELVFTETSIGEWNDGDDLDKRLLEDMREVALGTVEYWCKGVIVWNLMLDTNKGPNRDGGCQTCYGAVDIDNQNFKTITRNSHYYIVAHMGAVAKTGSFRIGTTGYTEENLTYMAFENPDNSYGVVILNEASEEKRITLADGNSHFTVDVPASSVVSCIWNK